MYRFDIVTEIIGPVTERYTDELERVEKWWLKKEDIILYKGGYSTPSPFELMIKKGFIKNSMKKQRYINRDPPYTPV